MLKAKFVCDQSRVRLDIFLTRSFGGKFFRGEIQRWVKSGQVSVNGRKFTASSHRLSSNDCVEVNYEKPKLGARPDIPLKVLFEDEDVLVIDKPAGLVVHPTPSQNKASVAAALLAKLPSLKGVGDEFRPGIVHRLDADTSGVMIVAKNEQALKYLQSVFKERSVKKNYIALVHGVLPQAHGFFDQPLGRRPGQKRFSAGFGRAALTEYWVERVFGGIDKFTLVRIQLHTGRTHQIRVHLASASHAVAGDRLYGGRFKKLDGSTFPRQFLHSASLKLQLPSGQVKKFESPLPDDLKSVLASLSPI